MEEKQNLTTGEAAKLIGVLETWKVPGSKHRRITKRSIIKLKKRLGL